MLQQDLVSQRQAGRLISTALLPLVSKRECQHCQMPAQGQTPRLDPHVCPQLTLLIVLRAQQTASAPRLATDSPAVPALSPILHPKLRPAGPQGRGPPTLCSQAHPPLASYSEPWPHLSLATRAGGGGGGGGCVLLQQLEAQAGELLLDAHHDGRLVLIALQLLTEVAHALPHGLIPLAQVGPDALWGRGSRSFQPLLTASPTSTPVLRGTPQLLPSGFAFPNRAQGCRQGWHQ